MKSIWPELGPGLGTREGVGGALAPQITVGEVLVDDFAQHGFYVLATSQVESDLPVVVGAQDWLKAQGAEAVIVRPDGYVLEEWREEARPTVGEPRVCKTP